MTISEADTSGHKEAFEGIMNHPNFMNHPNVTLGPGADGYNPRFQLLQNQFLSQFGPGGEPLGELHHESIQLPDEEAFQYSEVQRPKSSAGASST
jgi:hypothetical protein